MTSSLSAPLRAIAAAAAFAVLVPAAAAQEVCFTAQLSPGKEVPPVSSPARGTAFAIVDLAANTLTLQLTYDGLSSNETAAHIHGFANASNNAGILFPLPPGKHKNAVWSYAEADEDQILAGLTYVNVHSANFQSGELRGQLVRDDSAHSLTALFDGNQVSPPVATNAVGTGYFRVDPSHNALNFHLTFADLTTAETQAHLHGFAPAGQNAPILFSLPLGFHKTGIWNYSDADEASVLGGLLYVDIHSGSSPNGEIRGQVEPECTNPRTYCQGKANSQGCTPLITWSGSPTVGGADDFVLRAAEQINEQIGVFFWSAGESNAPFQGGIRCVASPVVRSPVLQSGGNPAPPSDCSGTFDFHFSDFYMAQNMLAPGDLVYGQFWGRDPADPFGTSLSNAVLFALIP